MRTDREYLDGLARLHRATDADERRALWRQSIATLAAEAMDQRPVPLEGLDPAEILASVRSARRDGLLDDLGFLSSAHASAALYELATVLPAGDEKRELGRRIAERLHQGDAGTFVALATQLAIVSRRALSGPAIRARVALSLELPIGSGTRADALALALVSQRDLAQEWLVIPSTGSLPSRRLAARLLERAAREAARRCAAGDDAVLSVFERTGVVESWARLLADREPLVWRHVATARGLLSVHVPSLAEEISGDLDSELSPTEWRRAAASLAASVAVAPQTALARATELLEGPIPRKDPGIASAMLLGLPRAAEAEPEAAEELCAALVHAGGIDAAEALLSLRRERVGGDFGARAGEMARAKLRELALIASEDEGVRALAEALDEDLRPNGHRERASLFVQLEAALTAFAEEGARVACASAQAVLAEVDATLTRLERAPLDVPAGRREAFFALRELDGALLETSILGDLLTLGARADATTVSSPLAGAFARLTAWLLAQEQSPVRADDPLPHRTLRVHRLRTLLHVVDADGGLADARSTELRDRRMRTLGVLLARIGEEGPALRRVVTATAARACDAVLREEHAELSEVLVGAVRSARSVEALTTMAEASMVPELEGAFRAYAQLFARSASAGPTSSGEQLRGMLDALGDVVRSLPVASTARVNALRDALLSYKNAVEQLVSVRSLGALVREADGGSRVRRLEQATRQLVRMILGARRRLGESPEDGSGVADWALRLVDLAVERAHRGETDALIEAVATARAALFDELPASLARVGADALSRVAELPAEAVPGLVPKDSFPPPRAKDAALPAWLPPSRTIGGFYVLHALGSGAGGSVFAARRAEEKKDTRAQRFALKVPEFTGAAARTLSEEEFLRLFREEAGALLAIPDHPNLARLVTFDAGARPKPILVMELVEGPTLERVLDTSALDAPRAFAILDGIAAGLEAMHDAGVGHLDVKPSNVILRDLDPRSQSPGTPVLVDFGLAGRLLRPGCATAAYGAPEVWGLVPEGHQPTPMCADVYAFACLAFEVLTGRDLVWAGNEVGIITAHLTHDGDFEGLRWLEQDPMLAPVADVLAGALRQDPRERATIQAVRDGLADLAPGLANRPWPLEVRVPGAAS
jgi:hypothetical protein